MMINSKFENKVEKFNITIRKQARCKNFKN